MSSLARTYWPEILACILLVAYTIIRTLIVAYGISPVSNVSWQIFLGIEIITTVPYVWAMGAIIRRAGKRTRTARKYEDLRRQWVAVAVAAASLMAPYVYLALYGTLSTTQGIGLFVGLLVVFTLPSIVKLVTKVRDRLKA